MTKRKRGLLFGFIFILIFLPVFSQSEEKRYTIPLANSPSLGPENAPVTIIEFIDFQ